MERMIRTYAAEKKSVPKVVLEVENHPPRTVAFS
jgi:hypothetical protein